MKIVSELKVAGRTFYRLSYFRKKAMARDARYLAHCLVAALFFINIQSALADADDAAPAAANPIKLKQTADGLVMLSLTADIQEKLGLKTATLTAAQWQPEIKTYGRVLDPAVLAAALADLATARAAADVSAKEWQRQKTLAAQNNASVRALETAQAAALNDEQALASALAKFKMNWGGKLAENGGVILSQITANQTALVRLDLPAGKFLSVSPDSARLVLAMAETNAAAADFFDTMAGVDPQTQAQSFFFLVKNGTLPANAAVTGFIRTAGVTADGAVVPADAVLRYEGLNWIYAQTGTNDFTRVPISLDRAVRGGWFVETIPATNRVIISGAQAALSAELSSGSFNTGERD